MKTLWERIESEDVVPDDEMDRSTTLLGELVFSTKTTFDEIDLDSITLEELKTLYDEISNFETEEEYWYFDCADLFLPTLMEAQLRNVMAEKMWLNSKNPVKKRFF